MIYHMALVLETNQKLPKALVEMGVSIDPKLVLELFLANHPNS